MNTTTRNTPLTVYKASAGSGKTFTLTAEYIKLLIQNPLDFKAVLAVTFTNKATEEMKTRILSQLYGIWKQLPDSKSYAALVCSDLDVSPAFASKRAGEALRLLLHNYSNFRIETIDSFFQSVLRNLARELDLSANLRVELNDYQVEGMAVDKLIDDLRANDKLLHWIIKYINDSISEDKSWNVIGAIKSFGTTIFKDFYRESRDVLAEKFAQSGFYEDYVGRLNRIKASAKSKMLGFCREFDDALAAGGLEYADLAYGKNGVSGFFIKLQNGIFNDDIVGKRVEACMGDSGAWATARSPKRGLICSLAEEKLVDILCRAVAARDEQWRRYASADLTLRHMNQLRLLNSIEAKVIELNSEANRFLLSDTQFLLKSLISDSDPPFVYEKIGTQIKYMMIDEFQDTSNIQWHNFKVLLRDSMSRAGARNIIVGDVKQSIYRWRDSDWRLLNNIEGQFAHPERQLEVLTLNTNYRSQRNIVAFNNAFFTSAARKESEGADQEEAQYYAQLKNAYADVVQKISSSRDGSGFVSVELLPATDDYVERTLAETASKIRLLNDNGVSFDDMAILVRSNKHIPLMAKYFAENLPEVSIVSDEAFRLGGSQAVNVIVQAMHLLTHRDDRISKAFLANVYQNRILGRNVPEEDFAGKELAEILPREYAENMDDLLATPLYDLAEQLFYIFKLDRFADQQAYVCAFFDQLSDFVDDNLADIDAFVDRWNETICDTAIQSGTVKGVRLLTIHKSKGLEFNTVIVPFCDWQLEKSGGNILWCSPAEPPYGELPVVPVDYGKRLLGTIYEDDYKTERLQNTVDNLNLLYVAFTRAGGNLVVIGKRNAANSRSEIIQSCLPDVARELTGADFEIPADNDSEIVFEYGTVSVDSKPSQKHTDNLFLAPPVSMTLDVRAHKNKVEFRQSNKSQDFIDSLRSVAENDRLRAGTALHKVFSSIATLDDISSVVGRLDAEGLGYGVSAEEITALLRRSFTDSRVRNWFSGGWTLFRECAIMFRDEDGNLVERRPDRVMVRGSEVIVVDFKFGRRMPAQHHGQVRQYKKLLEEMGYESVKGYLWYVYDNLVEEV